MGIFMKVPQLTLTMSSSRCLILKRYASCLKDDVTLVNIWTEKEELFPFLFRILLSFDFFICGQTFYCQQIFLTRMTRYEWIYKKIFSIINGTLTLAFELSKEMLVILLSSYENSSKWWILRLAEQRNGEYFAQLEVRLHPLNHKSRFVSVKL